MRRVVHLTAALTFGRLAVAGAACTTRGDGDCRAHHHLPLRAGAGDSGRAGGRIRRPVPRGVILNAGDAIERLAEADTVVFDKTGTLTLPEPRVVNAAAIDPELLQMAARLALSSRHPLAVALAREATTRVPFDDAVEEPGQGVRA